MKLTDEHIEQMLRSQKWIEPSADFTQRVLAQAPAFRPARRRSVWYERALMTIPALVILVIAIQHSQPLVNSMMWHLRDAGFWLGITTKYSFFAAYPVIILAVIGPLMAAAVASCALTRKCRIARVLAA